MSGELAAIIILALAIILVAAVALHAMEGNRANSKAIQFLENREKQRWDGQVRMDHAAARDIGRLKARLEIVEGLTRPSDGK